MLLLAVFLPCRPLLAPTLVSSNEQPAEMPVAGVYYGLFLMLCQSLGRIEFHCLYNVVHAFAHMMQRGEGWQVYPFVLVPSSVDDPPPG